MMIPARRFKGVTVTQAKADDESNATETSTVTEHIIFDMKYPDLPPKMQHPKIAAAAAKEAARLIEMTEGREPTMNRKTRNGNGYHACEHRE